MLMLNKLFSIKLHVNSGDQLYKFLISSEGRDRVGLAQSVACPPLVSSPLGRVIPKTIIKNGTNCLPAWHAMR